MSENSDAFARRLAKFEEILERQKRYSIGKTLVAPVVKSSGLIEAVPLDELIAELRRGQETAITAEKHRKHRKEYERIRRLYGLTEEEWPSLTEVADAPELD